MIGRSITLLLFGLCVVTVAQASERVAIPSLTFQSEGVTISEWRALGPIQAHYRESALERDFMAAAGGSEQSCRSKLFEELYTKHYPEYTEITAIDRYGGVEFERLVYTVPPSERLESAVYLASEIVVESDRNVWFILGCSNPGKMWVNGSLIRSWGYRETERIYLYDMTFPISLKAGSNFVLIKLFYGMFYLKLATRLEPTESAAIHTGVAWAYSFIVNRFVESGEALEIDVPAIPSSTTLHAEVQTYRGETVLSREVTPRTSLKVDKLPPGVYQAIVEGEGARNSEAFCIGTREETITALKARAAKTLPELSERPAIHLDSLLRRLDLFSRPLVQDESAGEITRILDRIAHVTKTMIAVDAVAGALALLENRQEAFRHRRGLHIRGFRSRVDDEILHYQVYVPTSYREEGPGSPVVILPVPPFDRDAAYIDSSFIEYNDWWTTTVGESLGTILLWPGYRIRPYGNPLDVLHIDEVLRAFAEDYNIDTQRLYFYGLCGGSMTSSMQVLRHPGRYAAMAHQNPVFHRDKNRYDDKGQFSQQATYRRWLTETDPLKKIAAVADLPSWVMHDSDDPTKGELSESVEFVRLARLEGKNPIFERIRPLPYETYSEDKRRINRQIKWMMDHRNPHPVSLSIGKEPKTGPLSRIFAERFIVVRGTQGNESEGIAAETWYKNYCEAWRRINFGLSCRATEDNNVDPKEERESHLILIGNSRAKGVWGRLAKGLPSSMSEGSIPVAGENWPAEASIARRGSRMPRSRVRGSRSLVLPIWQRTGSTR